MEHDKTPLISPSDPGDVVEAWDDLVLFTDDTGTVVQSTGVPLGYLPVENPEGKALWRVLALEAESLEQTLKRFPPLQIHEISCCDGRSFLLRIIPLTRRLAPKGGYVAIATDNRPMEALYETYEERLEDNIAAWSDSITLFNALFDMAKDATLLVDESGTILTANAAALGTHSSEGRMLAGTPVENLLGKRFRASLKRAMHNLRPKDIRTEKVVALDSEGEAFPAEAILRKISFTDYSLFQLILHDLSTQEGLREDLRDKKAEVEQMNIALRQVIRSVEEERQELREHLTNQVKAQMLPALERIAKADTAEIREGYKNLIEEQLVDLADDGSGELDPELLRLSPREMEVCQLIQVGRSGKDIAEFLNMSFETVQTHRKNIRRKLGLRGSKTSLYKYLRQKPSLG
ncbi:helix-turn-helix domain-containing protein [Salidesulfovibrio onnuriiensis]|uniref:helix-turn-helix domain-containing protein n=1 Tax=Salidesulfovibrio onnuriiensis TaxID=2583823 RepID=UPI0011C8DF2B|nr:helix-turn-helix transcriptional regulator [Salidesulfovibrio onnuriiensis]